MSPRVLLSPAASVPTQVSPETDACGPPGERSWLCSTVFDISENRRAAEIADWFDTPLRVLIILLVGWLVARFVRRLIRRAVEPIGNKRPQRKEPLKTPFGFIDTGGVATARRAQRAKTMADVLGSIVTAFIWGIAVLVALGRSASTSLRCSLAPVCWASRSVSAPRRSCAISSPGCSCWSRTSTAWATSSTSGVPSRATKA